MSDPADTSLSRSDDFYNTVTGVGQIGGDRNTAIALCVIPVTHKEAEDLWRGSAMAAVIVESPVWEMFRAGWEFKIMPEKTGAPTSVAPDESAGEDEPIEADPTARLDAYDSSKTRRVRMGWGKSPRTAKAKRAARAKRRADAFPPAGGAAAAGPMAAVGPPPDAPPAVLPEPDDTTQQQTEELEAYFDDLQASAALKLACQYRRAYGAGYIIIGTKEKGTTSYERPLDWDNVMSVDFLTVLHDESMYAATYYNDPMSAKFGKVELYELQAPEMTTGEDGKPRKQPPRRIHESRVIPFIGPVVSETHRMDRRGAGDSVFVRVRPVLKAYEGMWLNVNAAIGTAAQGIYKMSGLKQAIATKRKDLVKDRIDAMDYGRSILGALAMDPEDDFDFRELSFTGLPDLIDRGGQRLASVAGMPVTLLFGTSPGGLNATGDSDVRFYYDRKAGEQVNDLAPAIEYLARVCFAAKDGPTGGEEPENWCVDFKPLWQPTEKEKADTRLVQAQVDEKYEAMGVLTAAEIAVSAFGGKDYSYERKIDHAGRKELAAKHEKEAAEHAEKLQKAAEKQAATSPAAPAPAAPAKPAK